MATAEKNYFQQIIFQQIIDECHKLNDLSDKYLEERAKIKDRDHRDSKSVKQLWIDNTELGLAWFKRCGEDFDKVPEVVANIANGHTPYGPGVVKANGTISYILGLSVVSMEAHAWRLNDFLLGKVDNPDLPFGLVGKVK